jgi:hypothetical protein
LLQLVHMIAPQAAQIAKSVQLGPQAQALLAHNPSTSAFTQALADKGLNQDAVAFLSHGMQPRAGVLWAGESATQVAPKLPATEVQAASLAKGWAAGQTSPYALKDLLAQTPPTGPGTWAAQAGLLAAGPPASGAMQVPSSVTSSAIAGSVHLSAAVDSGALVMATPTRPGMPSLSIPAATETPTSMPAMTLPSELTPTQVQSMNDALAPFVKLGMQIGAGQMPQGISGLPAMAAGALT